MMFKSKPTNLILRSKNTTVFCVMIESEKERYPTMDRSSKKVKETEDKLHKQYKCLQQEWDSIKQSKPRTLRGSSTDSRTLVKALQLLENSPRNLMSSLQHGRSPLLRDGVWRVRNNDLAVEEILRERRAAIASGKLKGRRLFEAVEGVNEMGFGEGEEIIFSGQDGLVQESEVRSVWSYDSDDDNENVESKEGLSPIFRHCCFYPSPSSSSSSSSFLCDECMAREMAVKEGDKEVVVANVEEEKTGVNGMCNYWTRWIVVIVCLAIGFIVCAIGTFSMRSFVGHGHRYEVILVPT